ncbi:MAG: twin-arginine translocase subunit TatC [Haloferacaceae archaeon]
MSEDGEASDADPGADADTAPDGADGTDPAAGAAPDADGDGDGEGDAGGSGDVPGAVGGDGEGDADAPDAPAVTDGAAGADATPDAAGDGAVRTAGTVGTDPAAPAATGEYAGPDRGGPQDDVEMPLADHIEEMIRRLGIVFLVGGIVTLAVFPTAESLINYLWNTHIPGAATIADRRPRLYGPLELVLTELKVAGLAGLIAGLPVLVYQSYRFMRPGLYPHERRYYLAAVPTSLVLAFVGVSFAHFVVLPAIFAYFTSYTTGTALVAFGLRETFNLILLLMGYMAIVFQIPLLIMLGIMMGLVTRRWLEDKRLLFWGAFLGISFLVSPDPTGMAPIIVTVTMVTLYEGTLALLRWTGN